jgi:membrane protease subunit (stomatin/prohibitin family)
MVVICKSEKPEMKNIPNYYKLKSFQMDQALTLKKYKADQNSHKNTNIYFVYFYIIQVRCSALKGN